MQATEDRPPYVTFEVRSEEDRTASIEQGSYVHRDVDYAIITPQGSKDRIERKVEDWFPYLQTQVNEGRFSPTWLSAYKSIYTEWKAGNEVPENGTPIRTWPVLSPSTVRAVLDANIRTVEDLANANEGAIQAIGIGGRGLKQQAVSWLAAAKDTGKVSAENAALKLQLEAVEAKNGSLQEKWEQAEKRLAALEKK